MSERLGVLVMAYGTPRSLGDVEAYYTDIRHGVPPPSDLLEELTQRYKAIGGSSPLYEITLAQARGVSERTGVTTYLGQKHAAPFIPDAVAQMAADGVERAAGLVLAPHFSSMSVGDYTRRAEKGAAEARWAGRLEVIPSWHVEPGYVEWLAARVLTAFESLSPGARARSTVIFSAHSLPERILESGDPYPEQLKETAEAVARIAGLERWEIGWQSAGRTADPWIGPDIGDVIRRLSDEGATGVVSCPCGFVADHLEVLYDVDIEAREVAGGLGLELVRTEAPNADPEFLDVLAGVVRRSLDSSE
ncbi:MAG: ferrochelatase [Actinobacteria bacterium]|nr:ferrochelatase [Actinomycetota bacterium]